jgi:hypothetical protein
MSAICKGSIVFLARNNGIWLYVLPLPEALSLRSKIVLRAELGKHASPSFRWYQLLVKRTPR